MLELVIALAILGLVAGVVSVAIGRLSAEARARAAVSEIVNSLASARVEAMRLGRPVTMRVRLADGEALIEGFAASDGEAPGTAGPSVVGPKRAPASALRFMNGSGGEAPAREARFDTMGRTDQRVWRIAQGQRREGLAGREAVRIWRVEFDPISGAPVLRPPGSGGAAGQEAQR